MKYKLQVEKLKQITLKNMDGNLAMANQFENNEPMNITTEQLRALIADNLKDNNHKEHILKQFDFMKTGMDFFETELRRYYGKVDNLESCLLTRNKTIQALDDDIESLHKDKEHLINALDVRNDEAEKQDKVIEKLLQENKELHFKNDVIENICLQHQELTQWIEEEIDNEPDTRIFEVSHDFLENLYERVHKLNHEPY